MYSAQNGFSASDENNARCVFSSILRPREMECLYLTYCTFFSVSSRPAASRVVSAVLDVIEVRWRVERLPGDAVDENGGHHAEGPQQEGGQTEVALPRLGEERLIANQRRLTVPAQVTCKNANFLPAAKPSGLRTVIVVVVVVVGGGAVC